MPAFYRASVEQFLHESDSALVGRLSVAHAEEGFEAQLSDATITWFSDIKKLQSALQRLAIILPASLSWNVLLEFVIPRKEKRIDVVLLTDDTVLLLEQKTRKPTLDDRRQIEEYALLLHYFHVPSAQRKIVPIVVSEEQAVDSTDIRQQELALTDTAAFWIRPVTCATWRNLSEVLATQGQIGSAAKIDAKAWDEGEYYPVPSIIEAARSLNAGLEIPEIAHSRAAKHDVAELTDLVLSLMTRAKEQKKHTICFVTGVPGSGKTLVGLGLAFSSRGQGETLSFMSGNGPLVKVLQALFKDYRHRVEGFSAVEAEIHAKTLIEDVHIFAKTYTKTTPTAIPSNHVVIFDEAQRAWDSEQSQRKFGRETSEPTMFLRIMERHQDWALIIALVGGGQEINNGEAGIAEWGRALAASPRDWDIVASPDVVSQAREFPGGLLTDDPATERLHIQLNDKLQLKVSIRSLESARYAEWVDAVIGGNADAAREINAGGFPIYLTRSLEVMRQRLKQQVIGRSRIGLVGSSKAARLRAEGLEPDGSFHRDYDWGRWYLAPNTDLRASNQLEVFATEFEIQGLELDWIGLCWGGDLIWDSKRESWLPRKLLNRERSQWSNLKSLKQQQYRLNSYRVLMTRARQGVVLFVPPGSHSDPTRSPHEFDDTASFLLRCGVRALDNLKDENVFNDSPRGETSLFEL